MIEAPNLAGLAGIRHGFFGREGGVSEGVYASLNAGLRSGDLPLRVRENRARCAARLGLAPAALCTARQVHGREVVTVEAPWPEAAPPEADALVTRRPGLILGVLTADCVPVLLADPRAGVVAAVHAGWRGALSGVVEATVASMAGLGAAAERIEAAVGPAIGRESYEVGPELRLMFLGEDPGAGAFFDEVEGSDRLLLDLKAVVLARLARAGVERAVPLPQDTFALPARYFSYRRTTREGGGRFGLQLSAIARPN